jgi:surfeit locus 1 family protein
MNGGARRRLVWPSLFWLAPILILFGLGTWQIQRLHWKEGLIAQREAGIDAPPVALPATLDAARGLEFHHVRIEGVFQNGHELYLYSIGHDGKPGFHIVTPFVLADAHTILVDRGYVPETMRDPATRAGGQLDGRVTVTGLLRVPAEHSTSWFRPVNEPGKNLWFTIDPGRMAAAAGLGAVLPFYVDADATPPVPGGYPAGSQTDAKLPNDHLQYALTWFGLAVVAAIYYLLIIRGRLKEGKK